MSTDVFAQHRPGEIRHVTSPTNEVVKAIRSLDLRKNRAQSGLFVAEGARTLIEGLDHGADIRVVAAQIESLAEPPVARVCQAVAQTGGLVLHVTAAVMDKLSRRDNPQTVVGVVAQRWRSMAELNPAEVLRIVVLEGVRDPGNLGTIIRTTDALARGAVVLLGETTDPFSLEAVRATMGSIFAVPIIRATLAEVASWARAARAPLVGLHLGGSVDIRSVSWRHPSVLFMGNERSGLSVEAAAACDQLVRIPMRGRADSLNLAIATGIALNESMRAHEG